MLIHPSQNRKEYFTPRTLSDIKFYAMRNRDQSLSQSAVKELLASQKAVVATKEGTLESALDTSSPFTSAQVAALLGQATGLIIVPKEWQLHPTLAKRMIQRPDKYLSLDHTPTVRSLTGQDTLTQAALMGSRFTLEDLYRERCSKESAWRDKSYNPFFAPLGFRWRGSDSVTRFFTHLGAVKALELRALQNVAYSKVMVPQLLDAIKSGLHEFSGEALSTAQINRRLKKVARYQSLADKHSNLMAKLDVTQDDLIQTDSAQMGHFNQYKSWRYLVPSARERLLKYHVHLKNLSAVRNPMHSLLVARNFSSHCDCPAHTYQSDRATQRTEYVKEAQYICHHQIAAVFSATQIVNKNPHTRAYEVIEMPVFIPLEPLVAAANALRFKTVYAVKNENRVTFHPLSDASVNAALGTLFLSKPFESLATTQPDKMRSERKDILSYALNYVE